MGVNDDGEEEVVVVELGIVWREVRVVEVDASHMQRVMGAV